MERDHALGAHASLVDALDRLLERGAVLTGEAMLSLAGVDLIYLGLNLVIGSVETFRRQENAGSLLRTAGLSVGPHVAPAAAPASGEADRLASPAAPVSASAAQVEESQGRSDAGLARLVLTLVALLRDLLERQAVRRMEGSDLSEDDVERMGRALLDLERKLTELREIFGLSEADLRLDLGPLEPLLLL